jgi:PmbA protein
MTRLLAADPYRSLPDRKYCGDRPRIDLGAADPGYADLTPDDRHAMARAVEAACLDAGGARTVSVTARVQDERSALVLVNSDGFEGYHESTAYALMAQMTAQDDGDRRPTGYDAAVGVRRQDLPAPAAVGAGAATRTLALLGGRKAKTETLPIVVENRNVPRLLGGLLQAMSGRAVQQKQSFLADKRGQRIAGERLTLIDDPLLPGGLRSQLFDAEGMTAKRRTMIEAGILREFWVDWYYSRKLGWEPTTGGPTNLVIPPGERSLAAILEDLGRAILITDFIGGNSNSTTGDSSVGIVGQLFEKGEPVQAVAEMNVAGNALEFWGKLVEVGNDPWPYSPQRTPSLVFRDVLVAGV